MDGRSIHAVSSHKQGSNQSSTWAMAKGKVAASAMTGKMGRNAVAPSEAMMSPELSSCKYVSKYVEKENKTISWQIN